MLGAQLLTLDNGHDGALLDGGGSFETIGVYSAKEFCLEVHVVERVRGLIIVGLDLACAGWSEPLRTKFVGHGGARSHGRLAAATTAKEADSPSGTSSRPLSAMIERAETDDYGAAQSNEKREVGLRRWLSAGYRRWTVGKIC